MSRCLMLALLSVVSVSASPVFVEIRGTLDDGVAGRSPLVPASQFVIRFDADARGAQPRWDQAFAEFRLDVVATWICGGYVYSGPATAAYFRDSWGYSGLDLRWHDVQGEMLQAVFVPADPLYEGDEASPVIRRGRIDSVSFGLNYRVAGGFESYGPAVYAATDGEVPEPATLVLAGTALALAALRRRL